MGLIYLPNRQGLVMSTMPAFNWNAVSGVTVDAAGESCTAIGRVFLEAGAGSKVISPSGGKIHWLTGPAVTFANAGTTVRVGVQDVGSSGIEDGTFDVHGDLVGGTDTISASAIQSTPMGSGTKTIAHGDLIAVSVEAIARGGSDAILVARASAGIPMGAFVFPYSSADTGSGPARQTQLMPVVIEFDDGTLGWIEWVLPFHNIQSPSSTNFNNTSTPDEYAAMFKLPFRVGVNGFALGLGNIASGDELELILYADPLGSPTAIATVAMDSDFTGSTSTISAMWASFTSKILKAHTWYAAAVRPTTANNITVNYANLLSGNDKLKRLTPFGSNLQWVSRSDQSGAFSEVQAFHMPLFWLSVDRFEHGARASFQLGL